MKNSSYSALLLSGFLGLGLTLALLFVFGSISGLSSTALAAPAAELHVCPSGCAYTSIQAAVDAANPEDTIKVAQGNYTDIHARTGITQVVYIDKNLTLLGGFTSSDWSISNPEANPTTLDAQSQGRVIVVSGTITATIDGFDLTGGNASQLGPFTWGDAGGGIYVAQDALAYINNNQIYSNTAEAGGAIFLSDCLASLEGNTVISNTATRGSGGGIHIKSSPVDLIDNIIHNNRSLRSGWGGGVYIQGSQGVLVNNRITGNYTYLYGGGIAASWSNVAMSDNTISENTANSSGGGVQLYFSDGNLEGNLINHNNSNWNGGGIIIEGRAPQLSNNIIVDNRAAAQGSGVYIYRSSPILIHTTLARNTGGDGSGILVRGDSTENSNVTLTNTILVSHTLGITVTAGSTVTLDTTLWHANNVSDWDGAGTVIHVNDQYADPLLDMDMDGYHLSGNSPAIDQGIDVGINLDFEGQIRPHGSGYDIGADEFYCVPLSDIVINGPATGHALDSLTFTAIRVPLAASGPISYTWSPAPLNRQGQGSVTYRWMEAGMQSITLNASNCQGGMGSDTHQVTLLPPKYRLFLPTIVR